MLALILGGGNEVFQKIGRKPGATRQARLAVDRLRLLADRRCRSVAGQGDFLRGRAFWHQSGDVNLTLAGQAPPLAFREVAGKIVGQRLLRFAQAADPVHGPGNGSHRPDKDKAVGQFNRNLGGLKERAFTDKVKKRRPEDRAADEKKDHDQAAVPGHVNAPVFGAIICLATANGNPTDATDKAVKQQADFRTGGAGRRLGF